MTRESIRVGFVADPHIGRATRWTTPELALELHWRDVESCIAWCEREQCTHVMWLGDLFDVPQPTQRVLGTGMRALARCSGDAAITLGNHDVRDAQSHSLELLCELPTIGALRHVAFALRPRRVRWGAWRVMIVPWGHQIPDAEFDAVFFHEAAVGARMDNGRPSARGLRGLAELGVPAVGGHLHVPQNRGDLYFAGTSTQKSFGEPPHKRMLHLTLRPGRAPQWTSHRVRDPAWLLARVEYDTRSPPRCDAARTFYSIDLSGEAPPPRWMVDHPRVVTTHGSRPEQALRAASRVVNLLEGQSARGTDDRALLNRWLRQHASLDDLMRGNAMRLHDRLAPSE